MSDRAREVGVRLMWGNRAALRSREELVVNGVPTRFRWLIGADGTASQVRRWAGLGAEKAFSQRVSFRRHYETAPWSEYVEVHWGAIGQVSLRRLRETACASFLSRVAAG